MPTVQQVIDVMAASKAVIPGKSVRFDFGDEGSILLDGVAGTVNNGPGPVDATIRISFDNFLKLTDGSLSGTMAYMMGKLKVDGDLAVAMQLQSVTKHIRA